VRVIVTDQVFGDLGVERSVLEPLGVELVEAPSTDEETLVGLAEGADALLVCFAAVTERVVEAAGRSGCRVISRYGIGVDNIDLAAAAREGIRVTNVPDYCIEEVADHTVALLLAAARQIVAVAAGVGSGGWGVPLGRVHRLSEQRLALLGSGRIGRAVTQRALAFGLDVVVYDPYVTEVPADVTQVASLEEAVAEADYVSLHMPLTSEVHHVASDRLFDAMNRAPVLVNTSRGGLVDLDAAVRALDDGRLGGLAIDVTEQEPPPGDSPLRSHPRVILTPHMAFYSVESTKELQARAADEVARALRGEPARSPVQ